VEDTRSKTVAMNTHLISEASAIGQSLVLSNQLDPEQLSRLVEILEKESLHRMELERDRFRIEAREIVVNRWIGLVVTLILFAGALWCAYQEREAVGAALGGAAAITSALSFMLKKTKETE
jgi:uncharacterized membrane protein